MVFGMNRQKQKAHNMSLQHRSASRAGQFLSRTK